MSWREELKADRDVLKKKTNGLRDYICAQAKLDNGQRDVDNDGMFRLSEQVKAMAVLLRIYNERLGASE